MINWSNLDTLFLDMDGTLLDLHYDSHFWLEHLPNRYAQQFQLTPEQARQKIIPMIQAERGSLNWYCTDYWSDRLSVSVAALKAEVRDRIGYRPHVTEFLQQARTAGLNCIIVTNCHPDPLALKLEVTGLDRHVDGIVSSHQLGKPKEAIDFWADLQHWTPYNPATTLMIDDSIPVLESALSAGIAQCLAILAPDSQQAPGDPHPTIPSIAHFSEIMPLPGMRQNLPSRS
ncbi:GMP/IMP nucleotidase [Marinobacter sp.]|uniref:GMP/IMP nucleotidase n=1 Tax=Marinobacter sp. TaxID=50741 RepID=UPI00384E119D